MAMLHNQALCVTSKRAEHKLVPCSAEDHDAGESVIFIVRTGVSTTQDYFTPEQADEMAAAWTKVAQLARDANRSADEVFAAMQAVVDGTPDEGEGGRWHVRSDFAWQVMEDYRTSDEQSTIDDFDDEITTGDRVRAACVRDAAKATERWLAEDAAAARVIA